MKKLFTLSFTLFCSCAFAQLSPAITSWIINNTGATGYGGILSNVQEVQYSTNNVYVSCTCIPGYDIGPWTGNPNIPSNQNFVYKITLNPVQNTGTAIATQLGHTGVWSNGVSIFNSKDAMSYNNMGIWEQNAIVFEGASFDTCLGHPAPNGEYHHHLNPRCLYDDHDSSVHSPIIGYAFDGFPVYGAYGYVNTNGTGGITRMKSSFHERNITVRTTLPDGTVLTAGQYGPPVSVTYPLGSYIEDFEYIVGSGDLDDHNGRLCVTPEYPFGTYAYFVTLDDSLTAAYPYTPGHTYYGTVQAGNTGPGSGHNTITETVIVYTSISEINADIEFSVFPNPASDVLNISVNPSYKSNMKALLYNQSGDLVYSLENVQPTVIYSVDVKKFSSGMYYLKIMNGDNSVTSKVIIAE
jgi:hypothetical protein